MKRTNAIQRLLIAPLWASAFVLASLVVVQFAKRPAAFADEAIQGRDGFSFATVRNGLIAAVPAMPDCLWVLDNRTEMLYIYNIEDAGSMRLQIRYRENIATLFRQARGRLLRAVVEAPVREPDVPAAMGLADDVPRAVSLLGALRAEGLVTVVDGWCRLP